MYLSTLLYPYSRTYTYLPQSGSDTRPQNVHNCLLITYEEERIIIVILPTCQDPSQLETMKMISSFCSQLIESS